MENIRIAEISIAVTRKTVKNFNLKVGIRDGTVAMSMPAAASLGEARAFAASRLDWLRRCLERARRLQAVPDLWARPLAYEDGAECWLWGRRFRLKLERMASPGFRVEPRARQIVLLLPADSTSALKQRMLEQCYARQLRIHASALLAQWSPLLGVQVTGLGIRRMQSRWGSCTPATGRIRLALELAKRRREALEYVVLHEMAHLLEPNHSPRFYAILDRHMPDWRSRRALRDRPLEDASG